MKPTYKQSDKQQAQYAANRSTQQQVQGSFKMKQHGKLYSGDVKENSSIGNLNQSATAALQEQQNMLRRSTQLNQAQAQYYQNTQKSNNSSQGTRALSGNGQKNLQLTMVNQNSGNQIQNNTMANFPGSPQAYMTQSLEFGGDGQVPTNPSINNQPPKSRPISKRTSGKLVASQNNQQAQFYNGNGQPAFKQYKEFTSISSQQRVAQESSNIQQIPSQVRKSGPGTTMRQPSAKHHAVSGSADYKGKVEYSIHKQYTMDDKQQMNSKQMAKNLNKGSNQILTHFIKVKSKTNVQNTRQNSPGFQQKLDHKNKLQYQQSSSIGSRPSLVTNTNMSNQHQVEFGDDQPHITQQTAISQGLRGAHQVITRGSSKQMVQSQQPIYSQPSSPGKNELNGVAMLRTSQDQEESTRYQQVNTGVSGKGQTKIKNLSLSGTNTLKQSADLRMMNLHQNKNRLNSDQVPNGIQQYHSPPAQSTNLSQIGQISLLTDNNVPASNLYQTQNWQKKYLNNMNNTKANMIHMRKVNPVSKTAQTASKNTSVDRKHLASFALDGSTNMNSGQETNSQVQQHGNYVHPPQIMPGQQKGGQIAIMPNSQNKQSFQKLGEQRFIQKQAKAYTTKVSLNNTPRGSKKMNFGNIPDQNMIQGTSAQLSSFVGDATVQSMKTSTIKSTQNSNQKPNLIIQKPQQQMRQQQQPPIMQPQGDIPVIQSYAPNLNQIQNPNSVQVTQESSTSKSYGNKIGGSNLDQMDLIEKQKYTQSVLVTHNSKRALAQQQHGRPMQVVQQAPMTQKKSSKPIVGSMQATATPTGNIQGLKTHQQNQKLKMRLIMDNSPPGEMTPDQMMINFQAHQSQTPALISQTDHDPSNPSGFLGGISQESGGLIPQERVGVATNISQTYNNMLNYAGMSGSSADFKQPQNIHSSKRYQRNSAGGSNSGTFTKMINTKTSINQKSIGTKQIQIMPVSAVNRQNKKIDANGVRRQSAAPSSQNTGRSSNKNSVVKYIHQKTTNSSAQRSICEPQTAANLHGPKLSGQNGTSLSKNDHEMSQQYMKQYFKQAKNYGQIVTQPQPNKSSSQDPQAELQQHFSVAGSKRKNISRGVLGQDQVIAFKHFSQIESPKDSSIERARQNDMIYQEQQANLKQQQKQPLQQNHYQTVTGIPKAQLQTQGQSEKGKLIQGNMAQSFNHQHKTHEDMRVAKQASMQFQDEKTRQLNLSSNKKKQEATSHHYILENIAKVGKPDQLSPRSKEVYLIRQLILDCFRKYKKPPKTQLELYKIGKMLGKGAFGKVNLGLHRLTRKLCAIKSINMDFMKEESQKKKIMNEIGILKALRHPNNIKILETFQTDKHHMIVMELCPGGDLLNYVRKRRKLGEKYAKFVFKQIMEGIAYLHENGVAHRDIKLDNILLDGHGNIKIGDFGVSKKIEENEILFEQCGTPAYIAPEIVKDMGYKGFPVDIWSAGICLYAMLYGNVPFKANQIGDLNTVEQLNQDIEYKDTISKEAIDLMKLMLTKAPKSRATAQDALRHPWLQQEVDEHIDIFDEQELELIRKEFTYVLQKKKLKDFKDAKLKLLEQVRAKLGGEPVVQQASRRAEDLNTEFTECSIQTHENTLMKNDTSRSVILCPFNTQTGEKTADRIMKQAEGLMCDKDYMIRFHPRVRELDRNYEKLNNQDFDNGVYHKYAYKQKGKKGEKEEEKKTTNSPVGDRRDAGIHEESIRHSDVQVNNLVPSRTTQRKREPVDINYHNYYIKLNQNIINDTARLGFPLEYIQKCLKDNATNHCTTTYYLLCMDQNF